MASLDWCRCTVVFLDTDAMGDAQESALGQSYFNECEVGLVGGIVGGLLGCGVRPDQLGVISAFRPQVRRIQAALQGRPPIEVSTVDRYQGRDRDCVILSFVRSNAHHNVRRLFISPLHIVYPTLQAGHLLQDWHRLNVAFTRARKKLIMVGSWATIMGHATMHVLARHLCLRRRPLPAAAGVHGVQG